MPLSDAAMQGWRDRLKTILGSDAEIEFAVDAQLIAGVELHLPEAILRFSLQNALSSLRAEIEGHGNACR